MGNSYRKMTNQAAFLERLIAISKEIDGYNEEDAIGWLFVADPSLCRVSTSIPHVILEEYAK